MSGPDSVNGDGNGDVYESWLNEAFRPAFGFYDLELDDHDFVEIATKIIECEDPFAETSRIRFRYLQEWSEIWNKLRKFDSESRDDDTIEVIAEWWCELAAHVAVCILTGQSVQTDEQLRKSLLISDLLLGSAFEPHASGLGKINSSTSLTDSWRVYSALECFIQYCIEYVRRTHDLEIYRAAFSAGSVYVASVKEHGQFQHYVPAHLALVKTIEVLPEMAEATDLADAVHAFSVNGSARALEFSIDTPSAAMNLPTVRNYKVHLEAETLRRNDSVKDIQGALDLIEMSCAACVMGGVCSEKSSGCADQQPENRAESCNWLLETYIRCLSDLFRHVRAKEPLDYAVSVACGRLIGGSRAPLAIRLQMIRLRMYRTEEDRAFLEEVFKSKDLATFTSVVLMALLEDLPGDRPQRMFDALNIRGLEVVKAMYGICADNHSPIAVNLRLQILWTIAKESIVLNEDAEALRALELHWQIFEEVFRLSGLKGQEQSIVGIRQDAGPLHADLLARSGNVPSAIERLEIDRLVDLREDLTFLGGRLREQVLGSEGLTLLHRLRGLDGRYDQLLSENEEAIFGSDRIVERLGLRRSINDLRDKISHLGGMPTFRNPATIDDVQRRVEENGIPVVYLWSTSVRGGMAVVTRDGIEYEDLGKRMGMSELATHFDKIQILRASYRYNPSRLVRRDLSNLMLDLLKIASDSPMYDALSRLDDCLVVPVDAWHGVPLHALTHLNADLGRAFPILSYSATGTATASAPDTATSENGSCLVLANPGEQGSLLDWAVCEGLSIVAKLGIRTTMIEGTDITIEAITRWFDAHPGCFSLHMAGHAQLVKDQGRLHSSAGFPISSSTSLSPRGWHDLLKESGNIPALAYVSACESGSISDTYLDDLSSLQGAFLIQGVADVVVTQWPVNDLACAIFASDFYQRVASGGNIGRAMYDSRETLRKMTVRELVSVMSDLEGAPKIELEATDDRAFSDLWLWAPFVHYQGW